MGALLLLLLVAPAHAQPVAVTGGFDPHLVTNVYAAALAFMAPGWSLSRYRNDHLGMRGLTALDPDQRRTARGKLWLSVKGRVLATRPPPADTGNGWATAAVELASVAVTASAPVRRASTQGVVQSSTNVQSSRPYSRYVPPRVAKIANAGPVRREPVCDLRAGRDHAITKPSRMVPAPWRGCGPAMSSSQ